MGYGPTLHHQLLRFMRREIDHVTYLMRGHVNDRNTGNPSTTSVHLSRARLLPQKILALIKHFPTVP